MSDLTRQTIDAIWPEGSIWEPAPDLCLDNFLNGIADNWETVRAFLDTLDNVRDPATTTLLEDLEREFGVFTNTSITEEQRRLQLKPLVYQRSSNGSVDAMQSALDAAGFDVQVHENSPAVDPAIFLDQVFQMVAEGGNAYAGRDDAFASRFGGDLLVNGDLFNTKRQFTAVSGNVYAGDGTTAGEYSGLEREEVVYKVPTDPGDWPLVFFVGGDATRDGSGALTDIELADVPTEQESEFKRIILRAKPMHSWAGLIISYT
jgi:hypothetical protein